MECKKMNRKVWLFITVEGRYIPVLDKSKVYTVVGYLPKDDRLLVRNGNETKEIGYYECIVLPNEAIECESQRINDYLSANGIYGDVSNCDGTVEVEITWGDWKHDHDKLISLMCQNGYIHKQEIVTEDNGSDCYTADHVFVKGEKA